MTLPSLRNKGARYFAFINPNECFSHQSHQSPWMPSPHGAFAYLFNEDHSPYTFDSYFWRQIKRSVFYYECSVKFVQYYIQIFSKEIELSA